MNQKGPIDQAGFRDLVRRAVEFRRLDRRVDGADEEAGPIWARRLKKDRRLALRRLGYRLDRLVSDPLAALQVQILAVELADFALDLTEGSR